MNVPSSSSSDDGKDDYTILDRIIKKRRHARVGATLRDVVIAVEVFIDEMVAVLRDTGRPAQTPEILRAIYNRYLYEPTSRSWSTDELLQCYQMLRDLGFTLDAPIGLNQMLPPDVTNKDGSSVEQASVFVWKECGQQLGIDMDALYRGLEATELDKVKWSRRAKKGTNGMQNKIARHNACYTDLREVVHDPDPGDITDRYVRHKHPKNPSIKFTNYCFRGELRKFRSRFANVLGPFGHKFHRQFAELNKYYDPNCGIGWHGDVERGPGPDNPGSVNCLKVGRAIPLCFSWYYKTRPIGLLPQGASSGPATFKLFTTKKKNWESAITSVAACMLLGHGDVYMMSRKSIGKDWRSHNPALRHSAGHHKYTHIPCTSTRDTGFSAYSLTFSDVVENDSETPELQFSTPFAGM